MKANKMVEMTMNLAKDKFEAHDRPIIYTEGAIPPLSGYTTALSYVKAYRVIGEYMGTNEVLNEVCPKAVRNEVVEIAASNFAASVHSIHQATLDRLSNMGVVVTDEFKKDVLDKIIKVIDTTESVNFDLARNCCYGNLPEMTDKIGYILKQLFVISIAETGERPVMFTGIMSVQARDIDANRNISEPVIALVV